MPQWLIDLWAAIFPPPAPPQLFASGNRALNVRQLSSYAEGRALAAAINNRPRPMGGGVAPGDDEFRPHEDGTEDRTAGIYIPAWLVGPAAFRQGQAVDPNGVKYYSLHLRFRNGRSGMNVGLILEKFARYPLSQEYALGEIAKEAEQL